MHEALLAPSFCVCMQRHAPWTQQQHHENLGSTTPLLIGASERYVWIISVSTCILLLWPCKSSGDCKGCQFRTPALQSADAPLRSIQGITASSALGCCRGSCFQPFISAPTGLAASLRPAAQALFPGSFIPGLSPVAAVPSEGLLSAANSTSFSRIYQGQRA